jgi:hypothetical protein
VAARTKLLIGRHDPERLSNATKKKKQLVIHSLSFRLGVQCGRTGEKYSSMYLLAN